MTPETVTSVLFPGLTAEGQYEQVNDEGFRRLIRIQWFEPAADGSPRRWPRVAICDVQRS